MKKHFLKIACCFFLAATHIDSQAQQELLPAKVGDTLPDLKMNVINYSTKSVKLSDFEGKPVILDFGTIWCGGCISALPKLQKIQEQFGDQVRILPVFFNFPEQKVRDFYNKRKGTPYELKLPMAIFEKSDNPLIQLFPDFDFPCEVWLDKHRVVRAVSMSSDVTTGNIKKMLDGEALPIHRKHRLKDFDREKPLLEQIPVAYGDQAIHYQSTITGFNEGLGAGFSKQRDSNFTRLFFPNTCIASLLRTAMFGFDNDNSNKRLVLNVKDSAAYVYPQNDSNYWKNLHRSLYCYELIVPSGFSLERARSIMLQNLCTYFGIIATIEHRRVRSWVLKRVTQDDKIKTKGGEAQFYFEDGDHYKLTLTNRPISELASISRHRRPFFIDESGYTNNVDMTLSFDTEDYSLEQVNEQLLKYGLTIVDTFRDADVLVVTETSHY